MLVCISYRITSLHLLNKLMYEHVSMTRKCNHRRSNGISRQRHRTLTATLHVQLQSLDMLSCSISPPHDALDCFYNYNAHVHFEPTFWIQMSIFYVCDYIQNIHVAVTYAIRYDCGLL